MVFFESYKQQLKMEEVISAKLRKQVEERKLKYLRHMVMFLQVVYFLFQIWNGLHPDYKTILTIFVVLQWVFIVLSIAAIALSFFKDILFVHAGFLMMYLRSLLMLYQRSNIINDNLDDPEFIMRNVFFTIYAVTICFGFSVVSMYVYKAYLPLI